jgi:cytochrome c biogenesis protein CcmG, thiol:disulfide interchange protein DsbE
MLCYTRSWSLLYIQAFRYYSFVRFATVFITFFVFLLTGCYRGSHPPRIGVPAPDFVVQDDQAKIALTQFRGQVVVLNFWASWCPPCIEETPSLVAMQQQLKAKGVVVVAVSIDEDEDAYHRFIKQYGISFPTVRDPSGRIEHLYGTVKIPETYIIDRDGVLRRKFVSDVEWTAPDVVKFLTSL